MKHQTKLALLGGAIIVLATLAAYWPAWHGGFIWDDDAFLTANPLIKSPKGLFAFWFSTAAPDYFPMTSTTLWLEWRLWGDNPLGYHLVNVLLHVSSALLWWRVFARLNLPGAWLAAAIFALHPVNVESVAWITERKNTLTMAFYALALLAYLRFEESAPHRTPHIERRAPNEGAASRPLWCSMFPCGWQWYGVALGAFVLALLSKTAVAPLPLVLLGLTWWRHERIGWREVRRIVPFFAVAALLALVTIWFQSNRAIGSTVVRTDDFWSRLAGAGWAVWFYLYKAVLPLNLNFVYPRWQIDAASAVSYVPGLLAAAGLLVCWFYRRQWGKAWLLALGYFVVMLLPVLGFINIFFMRYSLVADHWQYFAILGPIALFAAALTQKLNLCGNSAHAPPAPSAIRHPPSAIVKPAACAALLSILAVLTWRQCGIYTDVETLWRVTLANNPGCFMAHSNLGMHLAARGRREEAEAHYREAIRLQPDIGDAQYNLANLLFAAGRREEAVEQYREAARLVPRDADMRNNLGVALHSLKRTDEAAAQFQEAIRLKPELASAHLNLGIALETLRRRDEAIQQYREVLRLQPDSAAARARLNALGTGF